LPEGRKPAAELQHAPDLAIEPRPVGDVHRHMLQQRHVESAVVEGSCNALAISKDTCPLCPVRSVR
jgi:hypothetical protein